MITLLLTNVCLNLSLQDIFFNRILIHDVITGSFILRDSETNALFDEI